MAKYYISKSMIAETWDGSSLHGQLDLLLSEVGEKHIFVTSTIVPAILLDELRQKAPKRAAQAEIEFVNLFRKVRAPITVVAPRSDIMQRWVNLRDTARREGMDLSSELAIELATADSLGVDAFFSYDANDVKFQKCTKITLTHFPIVEPETRVSQPRIKYPRSGGHADAEPSPSGPAATDTLHNSPPPPPATLGQAESASSPSPYTKL